MSNPYPIVRCTDPATRERLIRDLMALGFGRSGGTYIHDNVGFPDPIDWPYIGLAASNSFFHISGYRQADGHTLVNSAAHMLAYIKRAGIKP